MVLEGTLSRLGDSEAYTSLEDVIFEQLDRLVLHKPFRKFEFAVNADSFASLNSQAAVATIEEAAVQC